MTLLTPQERMEQKLSQLGIPAKEIRVYGSQIMITCRGRSSADKYAAVLRRFCSKVRGPWEGVEENRENRDTALRPTIHRVWRVWGTI